MKNYYAILGVTPQAEDVVIRAAYRALAQRYHPDRNDAAGEAAHQKMAELNEAYGVLSSPELRSQYDREFQNAGGSDDGFDEGEAAADEGISQINQDWEIAIDFYPDLPALEATLAKTSKSLAFMFKLYLIVEKDFANREKVANRMQDSFLCRYFGNQKPIIEFAKVLIELGRRDAARALNEAVRVLGGGLDPILAINRIKARFGLGEGPRCDGPRALVIPEGKILAGHHGDRSAIVVALASRSGASVLEVRDAILALRGNVDFRGEGCLINVLGCSKSFDKANEVIPWYQRELYPKLYFAPNS